MKTILRRVGRLEDRYAAHLSDKPQVAVRLLISYPWKGALNLATSTCQRTLNAGGAVTEIVKLDGRDEDIGEEELEKFIASFPIQSASERLI
jgi:hypothetical protein